MRHKQNVLYLLYLLSDINLAKSSSRGVCLCLWNAAVSKLASLWQTDMAFKVNHWLWKLFVHICLFVPLRYLSNNISCQQEMWRCMSFCDCVHANSAMNQTFLCDHPTNCCSSGLSPKIGFKLMGCLFATAVEEVCALQMCVKTKLGENNLKMAATLKVIQSYRSGQAWNGWSSQVYFICLFFHHSDKSLQISVV